MKNFIALYLMVFSLLLISAAPNNLEDELKIMYKVRLITHTCPNGYQFDYYDNIPGWTQEDYDEMIDSVCNDPDNQPSLEP